MWLIVTAASFVALGFAVAARIWSAGSMRFAERFFAAIFFGSVCWLATTWAFALAHWLDGPILILRTAAVLLLALLLLFRSDVAALVPDRLHREWLVVLLPVAAWVSFVLWRGVVVPPLNHDALAYHLPKAVLYERAGGFDPLAMLMTNLRSLPANYEMLLADAIATTGSDKYTEWIGTFAYLGFLSAAVALASKWWKSASSGATAFILAAGVPVALLHSGAHKNDLLVALFMSAAVVWFVRFLQTAEVISLACFIVATVAAVGTKPQAAILGALCAILAAPHVIRRKPSARQLLAVFSGTIAAAVLLGGAVYVSNQLSGSGLSVGSRDAQAIVTYGEWANLWKGIWVLVAAPFSTSASSLFVPGEAGPWFWRRYELFFSHLGIPFAVGAVTLAPTLLILSRTRRMPEGLLPATVATGGTLLALLPVVSVPSGMYLISLPRYAMFLAPIVFAATACALVSWREERGRTAHVWLMIGMGVAFFAWYAIDNARRDAFAPFDYVKWAAQHPGTRAIPFDQQRAASVIDRRAGASDAVALDAAYATWIHPAFGAELTRRVEFILPGAPIAIPDDVRWVGVDRAYQVVWGNSRFTNLSEAQRLLMRGQPQPDDLRIFHAMQRDPRFTLVFYNPRTMQAVFERVRPAPLRNGNH